MTYDEGWTDIGSDHAVKFFGWGPDWNIQSDDFKLKHANSPRSIDKFGMQVRHPVLNEIVVNGKISHEKGSECSSFISFDLPEVRQVLSVEGNEDRHVWQVFSLELPTLHVEPSLLCRRCGDHGFIRNGRWESVG